MNIGSDERTARAARVEAMYEELTLENRHLALVCLFLLRNKNLKNLLRRSQRVVIHDRKHFSKMLFVRPELQLAKRNVPS